MKNLVILLIFLVVLNLLIGGVITLTKNQSQDVIDDQFTLYVQNMEIRSEDIVNEGFRTATQSEWSTEMLPPVDANEAGITLIDVLKNSIWMDIPDENLDTDFEHYMIIWIKWVIYVLRFVCCAWAFILIYAKVVHQ